MTQKQTKGESDYLKYRGRCRELAEQACREDKTLTLVKGYYYCPVWNSMEEHWWAVGKDGQIHDPTKGQFPSRGTGEYFPWDGHYECAECGRSLTEQEVHSAEGRYCFCSHVCHGRFVGVF